MKASELLVEYYDIEADNSPIEYDDTRRPRLTFRQINLLRKSDDARKVDRAEYLASLPDLYNVGTGESDF